MILNVAAFFDAERKLRVNESRVQRLIDTAQEGICVLDLKGRLLYANRRFCDLLDYTAEEVIGRRLQDLTAGSPGTIRSLFLERLTPPDLALQRRDGTTVWTSVSASLFGGEDDQTGQLLLMFTDITARRLSEEAVRRSEQHYRALIENAADIVLILNRRGVVSYESPSTSRLLGGSAHSCLGQVAWEHVHPDDVAQVRQAFETLLGGPASHVSLTARFKHGDGTWHYLEGSATNLLDEPAVAGLVVNLRDVSERRTAEERAQAVRHMIEHLTADAVVICDARSRVVSWNQGAEQMFGWKQVELLGKPLPWRPTKMRQEARRIQDQVLRTGDTLTEETERENRSGERIPVLASWSRVPLADGQAGVLAIVKDLREYRAMHHRLAEQAESLALLRDRERIAMDLHDGVIQSLYGVTLSLGALRRQIEQGSAPASPGGMLGQAIAELTDTIENVREYIFELRSTVPDERELGSGLKALASRAEGAGQLRVDVRIETDASQLPMATVRQLLYISREALANVTRHANARHIDMCLRRVGEVLELAIADNGQGFEPGRRGRRAGDGLRNMRERARQIGADLAIDSRPGAGTTVRVQLKP